MTSILCAVLAKYEGMVAAGEISSFTVHLRQNNIRIKAVGNEAVREVALLQEVLNNLQAQFYETDSIVYETSDYYTLKGLLNTCVRKRASA